jgi:opacity protein-like surface antigen
VIKKTVTKKFKPTVQLSAGYGFPNLDKEQLADFRYYYKGDYAQTGPITGAIDYRFSRMMSIGLLVSHGKTSVPYYDGNNTRVLDGSLENWAFMLNLVRYMPLKDSKVTPYLRTAIGVNTWKQVYIDAAGNKLNYIEKPSELAYQAGIGAQFSLSDNARIFLEAGYGKYILHGGLSFVF